MTALLYVFNLTSVKQTYTQELLFLERRKSLLPSYSRYTLAPFSTKYVSMMFPHTAPDGTILLIGFPDIQYISVIGVLLHIFVFLDHVSAGCNVLRNSAVFPSVNTLGIYVCLHILTFNCDEQNDVPYLRTPNEFLIT